MGESRHRRSCLAAVLGLLAGVLGVGVAGPAGANGTTIKTAGDVPVGISVRVRATSHLSARIGRARAHPAPYVYRVTGRVAGRFVPDRATCTGRVTLTVRLGHHRLKRHATHLGAHCRYRFRIRLSALQLPADHTVRLSFHLRYRGSPNLTPAATIRHARAR
jgi:hypothetical protein